MMLVAVDRRHRRYLRLFTFCPFGLLWDIVDLGTAHILLTGLLFRLSPSWTAVLEAGELRTRLGVDAAATIASMVVAYVMLTTFIIRQGRRYIRVHTEVALARDIHRLLVPPIVQRVGRFEFRGFSIPSGEVGGDLVAS
jgi:hypothetical protein